MYMLRLLWWCDCSAQAAEGNQATEASDAKFEVERLQHLVRNVCYLVYDIYQRKLEHLESGWMDGACS